MESINTKKITFAKNASNDLKCIVDHGFHFFGQPLPPPPRQDERGGGERIHMKYTCQPTENGLDELGISKNP